MKYKFIKVNGDMVWGINDLTKERFVAAVKFGDTIINLEDMTQFDPETNSWKEIEGDK